MLEVKQGRYVAAIAWAWAPGDHQWMGVVWKDPHGPWVLQHRFQLGAPAVHAEVPVTSAWPTSSAEHELVSVLRGMIDVLVGHRWVQAHELVLPRTTDAAEVRRILMRRMGGGQHA